MCAPLDWQYAELPSSASDAVLCSVLVRKKQIEEKKKLKKLIIPFDIFHLCESRKHKSSSTGPFFLY